MLWDTWKNENIISVGWDIGDVTSLDWDEARDLIQDVYDSSPGYVVGVLFRFAGLYEEEEMKEGDIAIVLGSGTILDIAKIGEYEYNPKGLPESEGHTYWRHVSYFGFGPVRIRDLPDDFQQGGDFSIHLPSTLRLYNVDVEVFDELISAIEESEPVELAEGLLDFSEDAIQQYLVFNFKDMDKRLISVEREYSTSVGFVDLFGKDAEDNFVIIEVKIGTANDSSVGQLIGYMNAIRSKEKKKVRGILVAEDFTERVKEAVKSDDIKLVEFKTKLEFNSIT